jgi:hypothetical protein
MLPKEGALHQLCQIKLCSIVNNRYISLQNKVDKLVLFARVRNKFVVRELLELQVSDQSADKGTAGDTNSIKVPKKAVKLIYELPMMKEDELYLQLRGKHLIVLTFVVVFWRVKVLRYHKFL